MSRYVLSHLSDPALRRDLIALVAQDRATTAALLAHIAEFDARRLFVPAGYDSMYAWCLGELKMSEDEACKRIRVARSGRMHGGLFPMLADGRLTMTTALLLAPCLTTMNAAGLLAAAAGRSKAEVERQLAERFPRPDVPALVMALETGADDGVSAPERMDGTRQPSTVGQAPVVSADSSAPERMNVPDSPPTPKPACETGAQLAPERVQSSVPYPRVAPRSAGRYALQCTIDQDTHDLLRRAQALLGHTVPTGDLGQVLGRALQLLVAQLEKQRFAATDSPRACRRRGSPDERVIPAAIKRMVWQRDQGRCTFTSDAGHRCEATSRLEFDHIEPVARGGPSTPGNLRLRCRAHNQCEAERVYGQDFMRHKRERARHRALPSRESASTRSAGSGHGPGSM